MMHLGDDFARLESFDLIPDQEKVLDQMGQEFDDERVELLEQDAEIEMLESMMESGILQPQDL